MTTIMKHNASKSIAGTIYQFYIAIEECFKLRENEKLMIETYGDVTVSNDCQIEVKHYSEDLTDLHVNIWKTLDNWLQDNFDISHYKNLILMTTQKFGKRSSFKDWNSKSRTDKLETLDKVSKRFYNNTKQGETTSQLLSSVLNKEKKRKLSAVLDKFLIFDSSLEDSAYYENIKQVRAKPILLQNKDIYINSLLGYILSPTIRNNRNWEITYEDFCEKVSSLVNELRSGTIVFPLKNALLHEIDVNQSDSPQELYLNKIEDIEHHEVKTEAISDYLYTNQLHLHELQNYSISKSYYDQYEEELRKEFRARYRIHSNKTNSQNYLIDSQNFYDYITTNEVTPFYNFNNTPKSYRNGLLHGMANEENDIILWKLVVKNE